MQISHRLPLSLLLLLTCMTNCAVIKPPQQEMTTDIAGPWVRLINGDIGIEGFSLEASNRLRMINIFSMQGDTWSLEENTLTLFTHTERYPKPTPNSYTITTVSEKELVLVQQGNEIRYSRPPSDNTLVDSHWRAYYVPGDTPKGPPEQEISFRLHEDSTIDGFAGCNNFRGNYSVTGDKITIGPLLSTQAYCPAMALENNLFKALSETTEFMLVADQLYLYKDDGFLGFFLAQKKP